MRYLVIAFVLAGCGHHADGVDPGGDDQGAMPDAATPPPPMCSAGPSSGCLTGSHCTPAGTCAPGCAIDSDCATGEGCCGTTCKSLDTLTDCGSCGNACATGDFCDTNQCEAPTYPNFCANKTVYVIHDDITSDDAAADVMASTITANCPADVVVHTASQTDASLVDQTTGQPLGGGGVTYVLGGGPFPNHPLDWLEHTQAITKIYFDAPDGKNFYWRDRTGTAVATMAGTACSPHADQFITELVTDPSSGTLSLVGYGACSGSKGTLAAAWYYANVILPNSASYPDSWYVFGWADTDNDATPSAGDTFTVLAHGM